jgi:hypothetical protein
VLFALALDFESLLLAVHPNGDRNCFIQYLIQNRPNASRNGNSVRFCKLLNRFSERVIVSDDLNKVKALVKPLQSVDLSGRINWQREQRLLLSFKESRGNIVQQASNVAICARCIKIPNRWNLLYLVTPELHEFLALLTDEIRQLRQIFVTHPSSLATIKAGGGWMNI